MSLTVDAVPILSDNYAWLLRDSGTGAVAIVDPADATACIAAIDAAGGRLDKILITHHHDDHIAGVDEVRARYGATVVGASADARRLPKLDEAVEEGDVVELGGSRLRVIETPGHTIGHIAFYAQDGGGPDLCGHAVQPGVWAVDRGDGGGHVCEFAEVGGVAGGHAGLLRA